ncbi:MAG: protein kinase, partial [Planctomycetota bacterium]
MDRRDLLRADIAVSLNLVSADEAANGGLLSLSDVDQTRIEQEMATVLDAAEGDVDRALRDRGIDAGLNAHLEADVSHALAESGTRSRTRLRTLEKGRYAGFMPLGEGGMGTVYLALDTELNRKVAFKMIRTGGAGPTTDAPTEVREDLEARFFQEAWVTGSLEHPGIVPIYELGRTPSGVPYYTMRPIRGERTLDTAIQEAATPEERLALLEPFLKVCDAIRYAHARHVVHRDLKPANVALGPYGEVVVLDWGLAKLQEERAQADSRWQERLDELREQTDLKTLASALGTPGFMAPEAALGRVAEVDARSDVYSLGAILHLVLTGRYPFSFGSYADYVRAVQQGIESVLGVPAGLERICLQAMATEREERYADAGALAADIRRWQAESVLARERDALDKEVRSAFEVLDSMEGDGKLQQLDRVVALASRMRELAPDDEEPDAILARVHAQRADTMRARERTVRRALLRRVAALALLVGTGAAVLVAVLLEGRRREAVDARAQESIPLAAWRRPRARGRPAPARAPSTPAPAHPPPRAAAPRAARP